MARSKRSRFSIKRDLPKFLPLIAGIVIGLIGLYLTFSSNAAPTVAPGKVGIVDDGEFAVKRDGQLSIARNFSADSSRNPYVFAVKNGGMRHTVLNVGVRELITVNPDSGLTNYIPGSIEKRIAPITNWNKENPDLKMTVHLRFNVGELAPDEWKKRCGTVTMTDPNYGGTAITPRWWTKSADGKRYIYRDFYAAAMRHLGDAVEKINNTAGTINIIGSVNVPGAAPKYPEPFLIYAESDPVRKALVNAGFTAEAHRAFLQWLPNTVTFFRGVNVEIALNPAQNIGRDGKPYYGDEMLYKEVAKGIIKKIGSRTVLANYSARASFIIASPTSKYGEMYNWMIEKTKGSPRVWAGVQMARPTAVAISAPANDPEQWDNVARWAANKGFNFAETTGSGNQDDPNQYPDKFNIWPKSYNDDADDVTVFKNINTKFFENRHP